MNKALDSEEYKRHREALERRHEATRRYGLEADRAGEVWELVKLEVQFTAGWEAAMSLANLAHSWMTKRNPHYLDLALAYCHQNEIPPTPTLWRLLGELAEMRMNGDEPPGEAKPILERQAKASTLMLMANLIYHGDTLEAAASKAASQHAKRHPGLKAYKASTLEKYYVDEWRKGKSLDDRKRPSW